MTLDEYQEATKRTASDDSFSTLALGLAGESGEVADIIKKHVGHGHELDKAKLVSELGDVLWYIARLASVAGFTLDTVATGNIAKLKKRYPDGFSPEASKNRIDS